MSEGSEGYRKTSVKPCGYTSWPQTREMLPRRTFWLVLMEAPTPPQNDARIAMQPGRAYEASGDFGAARTDYFKAAGGANLKAPSALPGSSSARRRRTSRARTHRCCACG